MSLRDYIGLIVIFAFVTMLPVLFIWTIPAENESTITLMIGQLSGFAAAVIGLHYGANKTDEDKTANTGKAFDAITAVAGKPDTSAAQPIVVEAPASVEVKPG